MSASGNTTSVILNETCFERYSIFFGIPYLLFPDRLTSPTNPITGIRDDNIQLWIHIGLLAICLILAIINVIVQFIKTIPYGRHDKGDSNFPRIPARISFAISQFIPGILVFSLTYFFQRNFDRPSNIIMYCLFTIHYINRSIVDGIASRHSQSKVSLWIPILAALVNILFHFVNAQFIGEARYCEGYYFDPRFILGLCIFFTGFILNRVADAQLIVLRSNYKDNDYKLPTGCSFCLISCPNYLGEAIEWFGWSIMTWSLSGLVWFLFSISTFIPRSRQHHKWYHNNFDDYPKRRKALLPFIY